MAAGAGVAATNERLALVIGNSDYAHVPYLPNAAQDARDVTSALRQLGFEVYDGYDLTRVEALLLIAEVTGRLQPDDLALFYFSGHGVQIGAENFVIPVDASGETELELKDASVSLQSILREMDLRAERNIIILDACRNNPFESRMVGRSVGGGNRGLAKVDAGIGSYIAFSTQPGNVALDGTGRNSPFTEALLRHLPATRDDLHELMRKVRADVISATNGTQVPWENSSLIERVYLSPLGEREPDPAIAVPVTPPVTQPPAVTVTPPAAAPAFSHVVSGLDPNGDGFLALRTGTTSGARRIAKMTEGTRLSFLGQSGAWFHVRTETGLEGWAHSNWIRAISRQTAGTQNQCEALWLARNAIFSRNGYCFQSARGKAAFSNAGCIPGMSASEVPLSAAERAEVERLAAQESSLGCR